MKKIFAAIRNYFNDYFRHREIYLRDKFYDYMTDNDELDDIPTIVKVTYSKACGIIDVSIDWNRHEDESWDAGTYYEFCKICKINKYSGLDRYKKYTIYKK